MLAGFSLNGFLAQAETLMASESVAQASSNAARNPEIAGGEKMKSLVLFYSWSGNTGNVAAEIARQTGADVFRIEPVKPHADDYDELVDLAKVERRNKIRPEFKGGVDNLYGYDVIFLGFPNWWPDLPMIVYAFLDKYDLSGKAMAPFCSSGGSAFSKTIQTIKSAEPEATALVGLHVGASRAANPSGAVKARGSEN